MKSVYFPGWQDTVPPAAAPALYGEHPGGDLGGGHQHQPVHGVRAGGQLFFKKSLLYAALLIRIKVNRIRRRVLTDCIFGSVSATTATLIILYNVYVQ